MKIISPRKRTAYLLTALTISLAFFYFSPSASAQSITNGSGGLTAGSINTVPSGYGLTGIGFGSDDTRCTFWIIYAPVDQYGIVDYLSVSSWRNSACSSGGGDDETLRRVGPQYQYIATGWSWGANTTGGHDSTAGTPPDECYYQEYARLTDINNRSGWGASNDGSCDSRGYSSSWLRGSFEAPSGNVIVGVGLNLANDADVKQVTMNIRREVAGKILSATNP